MSPGLLAIMGSGETAPTMVKVHRSLLARVGTPGVLLDTPYGFQENAEIISARAVEYFGQSVGAAIDVASWRSASVSAGTVAAALEQVRSAAYVFAGPGSPTYALSVWDGTELPSLLAAKLDGRGCVTFASAAALTLGVVTVPVYEIYKVGAAPAWVPGLDLLASAGLSCAVIPHYDNAEGGNHDTRFCYLGERRLALLEASLPSGAFVLGVDEHTAAVLDLAARTVEVLGNGGLTVRIEGASTVFPAGSVVGFDALVGGGGGAVAGAVAVPSAPEPATPAGLLAEAARLDAVFTAALSAGDVQAAVSALLELDAAIVDWSRDTLQSDEPDRARAVLRSMVVRLGGLAEAGAPIVAAVVAARDDARARKDFTAADRLRDALVEGGIEIRDEPGGTAWSLRV